MRTKFIILLFAAICCGTAWSGCKKYEVQEQEDASVFYPRIFGDNILFPVPAITSVITVGQSKVFSGLTYSPADQVTVTWKVNDAVVAESKDYTFTGTSKGLFTISVEVAYNGLKTSRTCKVQVN